VSYSASVNFDYIRKAYGVPAKLNGQVIYSGGKSPVQCTIIGCEGARLVLRENTDAGTIGNYHPTWKIEYLESRNG